MYLLTKAYFGCGIMNIIKVQEQILMKVCKITILKKLGFSKKFPRKVLHSCKIALGIGLIKLSTIIVALVLKLYIGYKRMKSNISKMIDTNKEIVQVQHRHKMNPMKTPRSSKPQNLI